MPVATPAPSIVATEGLSLDQLTLPDTVTSRVSRSTDWKRVVSPMRIDEDVGDTLTLAIGQGSVIGQDSGGGQADKTIEGAITVQTFQTLTAHLQKSSNPILIRGGPDWCSYSERSKRWAHSVTLILRRSPESACPLQADHPLFLPELRGSCRILILAEPRAPTRSAEAVLTNAPQQLDPEKLERLRCGLRLIALRSLSDADTAEDVVQETLARGLEALRDGRLHDPTKLGAYFRGICHHVIVDTIRARRRTTSLEILPERSDGGPAADALHTLISEEQKARVIRALRELSPVSRECLRLSFYEGLKPAEVAARLGEPGPRIRKRRSRALRHLREVFLEQDEKIGSHENPSSSTTKREGRKPEYPTLSKADGQP